jgi:hypothetical protein
MVWVPYVARNSAAAAPPGPEPTTRTSVCTAGAPLLAELLAELMMERLTERLPFCLLCVERATPSQEVPEIGRPMRTDVRIAAPGSTMPAQT